MTAPTRRPPSWNLADLAESVVDVAPTRDAVVGPEHRLSYEELDRRANRLAHRLAGWGVGPGDRVGLALRNGHQYLEAMLGAFKLRAIPANLNLRYTADELTYLFGDADPAVVIHEDDMADRVSSAARTLRRLPKVLRASDYEEVLASAPDHRPAVERSGDDRYLLYTGGTTGLPKGVVWRHEDLLFAALGGGNAGGDPVTDPAEVAVHAAAGRSRCLAASPFTHGTAHWMAWATLLGGGTVIVEGSLTFDPERVWDLAAREAATALVIVGDAFAQPLTDALARHPRRWDLDALVVILSGGATLSPTARTGLLAHLPWAVVVDGYGTSETGGQGQMPYFAGQRDVALPRFHVDADTVVLDDAGRPAPPGSGIAGRLAHRGHVPVGYHGDPEASARTFVELGGQRWVIPGDLARIEADGSVTLLGRGSSSINTGGEKVFAEEVEMVLKTHPSVLDAVVVGVPDPRFGERVAAVVAPRRGHRVDLGEVTSHCRAYLAPFKVPRHTVVVDTVARRPSGKVDLVWARDLLTAGELSTGTTG